MARGIIQPKEDPKLERYPDWERRFVAWCELAQRTRFKWGVFDCGLMGADSVIAITGVDPAADVRGHYDSEEGAEEVLGGSFLHFCTDRLGEPIDPRFSRRGDLGLGLFDGKESLMVDCGSDWLVAGPVAMRIRKDLVETISAWRIG